MKFTNQKLILRTFQKGFTLMEVSIVLIILAALVATMASNLWSRQDSMSYQQAILFFQKTLPQAMASMRLSGDADCLTSNGCGASGAGSSTDITAKLQEYGAPSVTEWGEAWTASYAKGAVEIDYCVDGLSAAALGALQKNVQNASKEGGALIPHGDQSPPNTAIQGEDKADATNFTSVSAGCTKSAFFYVKTR